MLRTDTGKIKYPSSCAVASLNEQISRCHQRRRSDGGKIYFVIYWSSIFTANLDLAKGKPLAISFLLNKIDFRGRWSTPLWNTAEHFNVQGFKYEAPLVIRLRGSRSRWQLKYCQRTLAVDVVGVVSNYCGLRWYLDRQSLRTCWIHCLSHSIWSTANRLVGPLKLFASPPTRDRWAWAGADTLGSWELILVVVRIEQIGLR